MEIMVSDDGYDKDIEPLDSKDDYNGNVSHYVPFKALVQVVAVSKHGEE